MLNHLKTLLYEAVSDPASAGASAAGTGETPGLEAPPAAEPTKPDSGAASVPETIPYDRFKEVNDELRELKGYRQFEELGYDPDSLGRLVSLESSFAQDPLGTLESIIESVDVIPDSRKAALKELIAVQTPAPTPDGEEAPSADEPPEWAKPLIEDHTRRVTAEAQAADDAQLDRIIAHWKKLDEEANITTPDSTMLAHIHATAGLPGIETEEQLAEAARAARLEAREHDLGGAVVRRGEGSPLSVPSGGAPATQPVKFTDIKAATRAALSDIQQGRLGGAE